MSVVSLGVCGRLPSSISLLTLRYIYLYLYSNNKLIHLYTNNINIYIYNLHGSNETEGSNTGVYMECNVMYS